MVEGITDGSIQGHHQLGHAELGRPGGTRVGGEPKLALDGGLDASPVEALPLDGRRIDGLGAHQLDCEQLPVRIRKVTRDPDQHAGTLGEGGLRRHQPRRIPGEFRPVGLLTVRRHDR